MVLLQVRTVSLTLARYNSFNHLLSHRKFPIDSKPTFPRLFAFNRMPETLCLRPSSERRYLKSSTHPSSPRLLWRRISQATASLFESASIIILAPGGCPESATDRAGSSTTDLLQRSTCLQPCKGSLRCTDRSRLRVLPTACCRRREGQFGRLCIILTWSIQGGAKDLADHPLGFDL